MVAVGNRALEIVTDSPPLTTSVRLDCDLAISVCRELDMATARMTRFWNGSRLRRVTAVAFDLVDVTSLDAAGLGSLLFSISDDGAGVSIRNPSRAVRRVLEIVELEGLIESKPLEVSA